LILKTGPDIKVEIPAVKGFKAGKAIVFMPAIGIIDLMPQPWAPDGERLIGRIW